MPLLEPVIWAKGTVLNPQHLQIQDRFLVDSLQFHLQALNFRPWGFERLRIDQQALTAGTFTLAEAVGIMADGLLLDIPESDSAPPSRTMATGSPRIRKLWGSIFRYRITANRA
jgi:type VI secretion system protein ImpJ